MESDIVIEKGIPLASPSSILYSLELIQIGFHEEKTFSSFISLTSKYITKIFRIKKGIYLLNMFELMIIGK